MTPTDLNDPGDAGSCLDAIHGYVTTISLNLQHPVVGRELVDACSMHSRIIDATTGISSGLRVLYALPTRDQLTIRAGQPILTAHLPAGYAAAITHRPWFPPTKAGLYRMVGVVNPGRSSRTGGPTRNQPDRKKRNDSPRLYPVTETGEWLARRLAAATVVEHRITRTWTTRGTHRTGRTITARCVAIAAIVDVHDSDVVATAVTGGIGIDRTWGCGLTLWEPLT